GRSKVEEMTSPFTDRCMSVTGIHYCLGAPLARLELTAVFGALLRRAPGLRPAAEPEWRPGYVIRGLKELPVTV
ncbi:hypothetical protein AB0R11_09260, partial [Streptomyces fradiae]